MPGIKEMVENIRNRREEELSPEKKEEVKLDDEAWEAWHEWFRQIREEMEELKD